MVGREAPEQDWRAARGSRRKPKNALLLKTFYTAKPGILPKSSPIDRYIVFFSLFPMLRDCIATKVLRAMA
jgi:hypothetical protein